jgi:ABC-type uncharacterized transport system ATPase subunit
MAAENRYNVERLADSWAPDTSRALGSVGPFRVASGRAIVDTRGRVVAMATTGAQWDEMTGRAFLVADAIGAAEADNNAHAIAHALNVSSIAPRLAEALRALASPQNFRADPTAATLRKRDRALLNAARILAEFDNAGGR